MVEEFTYFQRGLTMIQVENSNIFRAHFSVKETLVLSFEDVVFSKGGFLDDKIKLSFYYSRKISILSKRLTHDSCPKFQISFQATFLCKRPWFYRLMMMFS